MYAVLKHIFLRIANKKILEICFFGQVHHLESSLSRMKYISVFLINNSGHIEEAI